MNLGRHPLIALMSVVVVGGTMTAAASTADGTLAASTKPVIGKPVAVPAQPVAGKRFAVSFKVTRSDTGAPLLRGKMICDPSVAGKVLRHAESFAGGAARLSFVVPVSASGKLLKVKVTIATAGRSTTRVSVFHVGAASLPVLSIGDVSAAEGNAGTTTLSFPVRLSSVSTKVVSVGYATSDRGAKQPADYASSNGTLTFAPGETAKAITVAVVGDTAVEQDETFAVTLFNSVNATIAKATATGTITNDDSGKAVTAGDWKGATQEGNYVYFSVLGSRKISGFRVNALPCRCRPGTGWLEGGEDLGDVLISVKADATFASELTWAGSQKEGDLEWTNRYIKVVGSFPTATTAKGTIVARYQFNEGGVHYTCNSRVISWTAALQS